MRKHNFKLLLAVFLLFSPALSLADDEFSHSEKIEKLKNMSPEERKAHHEEKKAEWEAMSKQEKLSVIEERRADKKKRMDEKWNAMSDDDKISYVEKRMKDRRKDARKARAKRKEGKAGL